MTTNSDCCYGWFYASKRRRVLGVGALIAVVAMPWVSGCLLGFGDCDIRLDVRGRLVDAESGVPISDTIIGGRTFTDNDETAFLPTLVGNGTPDGPPTTADGAFNLQFSANLGPCPPAPFLDPDRIEIIVLRDDCEQSFFVDINEETVVNLAFPDDTLDLIFPILVPACGEANETTP